MNVLIVIIIIVLAALPAAAVVRRLAIDLVNQREEQAAFRELHRAMMFRQMQGQLGRLGDAPSRALRECPVHTLVPTCTCSGGPPAAT